MSTNTDETKRIPADWRKIHSWQGVVILDRCARCGRHLAGDEGTFREHLGGYACRRCDPFKPLP
jgi:hypothetical protein